MGIKIRSKMVIQTIIKFIKLVTKCTSPIEIQTHMQISLMSFWTVFSGNNTNTDHIQLKVLCLKYFHSLLNICKLLIQSIKPINFKIYKIIFCAKIITILPNQYLYKINSSKNYELLYSLKHRLQTLYSIVGHF